VKRPIERCYVINRLVLIVFFVLPLSWSSPSEAKVGLQIRQAIRRLLPVGRLEHALRKRAQSWAAETLAKPAHETSYQADARWLDQHRLILGYENPSRTTGKPESVAGFAAPNSEVAHAYLAWAQGEKDPVRRQRFVDAAIAHRFRALALEKLDNKEVSAKRFRKMQFPSRRVEMPDGKSAAAYLYHEYFRNESDRYDALAATHAHNESVAPGEGFAKSEKLYRRRQRAMEVKADRALALGDPAQLRARELRLRTAVDLADAWHGSAVERIDGAWPTAKTLASLLEARQDHNNIAASFGGLAMDARILANAKILEARTIPQQGHRHEQRERSRLIKESRQLFEYSLKASEPQSWFWSEAN
jgi:hypothetical protein